MIPPPSPARAIAFRAITLRQRLSAFCVAAGLLALGGAIAAQIYAHMTPCPLCLWERWPYRALIAFGLIGVMLPRSFGRVAVGLAIVTAACGLALAVTHLGVERHLWKSPLPLCGGIHLQPGEPLPADPSPPCDAPALLWPRLPVSMAALNGLAQLMILLILLSFFPRTKREVASHAKSIVQPIEKSTRRPDGAAASGADDPG